MTKEAFYFSHDSNARQDEKIIALRMRLGWEGYGIYWAIVEKLREASDYKLSIDYNVISFDLRIDSKVIKAIVEDFGLFVFSEDGKLFWSDRMMRNMEQKEEKSKKARDSANKRWSKSDFTNDSNAVAMRTHNEGNAIKEKKEKEIKENKPPLNPPNGGNDHEFFITKKKRKLTGKRLETFNKFWEKFNYRKGKAEAADSWMDIPELTVALCEKINMAAEMESKRRPELELSGKTPKMAQGWLTARRWEDEIYEKKQISHPEKEQIKWAER